MRSRVVVPVVALLAVLLGLAAPTHADEPIPRPVLNVDFPDPAVVATRSGLVGYSTGDLVPHAGAVTRSGGLGVMRQFVGHGGMDETVADLLLSVAPPRVRAAAGAVDECARRDVKGLYAKAFSGEIKEFTGVSDPYEEPVDPDLKIDTEGEEPRESAQRVLAYLQQRDLLSTEVPA